MDKNLSSIKELKNWLGTGSINIFGSPFAGKDTQASRLAELLDAPVIGGGDILRAYHDQEKITQLMSTGELFPTDFYLSVVLPFLSQTEFADKPLVLSSVGRWLGEEAPVLEAAKTAGHPIKAAVFLSLDEAEIWKRWEISQQQKDRGLRHDDAKEVLKVRLDEFKNKTLPVLDTYRQLGLLVEIDGSGELAEVTQRIIDALLTL